MESPDYAAATRAVLGEGTDARKLFEGLLAAPPSPVAGRWSPYDPVQGNELGLTGSFGAFAGVRRLTEHQTKNPPVRRVTGANQHHK
ncbi:hypothetical protein NKH57_04385 [Mesorhizobium sp. M1050]|uniref:hypothetical protein n=1 Tax=Mesorhizobium sp. M1050 TaxID=2957051 RepID=UPI00333A87CE